MALRVSEEWYQQRLKRRGQDPAPAKPRKRSQSGKRADLGNRYFRSAWEANVARYLNWLVANGQLFKWEYEPDTYWFEHVKTGSRSYKPDFKLWDNEDSAPYYWEVKGWMDQKSRTKLKRMARYYPDVKVFLISRQEYHSIANKVGSIIEGWEICQE